MNIEDIAHIGQVFLMHKGRENGLTKTQLYEEYYGETYNPKAKNFYEQLNKWKYLRTLMKHLRKNGEQFIVYEPQGLGNFKYYLLNKRVEGEAFNSFLQKIIDAHKRTQERCEKYMIEKVDKKYSFSLFGKNTRQVKV